MWLCGPSLPGGGEVVTSSIGSREDVRFLADRLAVIAGALRRRREPLDGDASILGEVGVEIAAAAKEAGDWPHAVLSRGKVLGWAHRILGVVEHLKAAVGDELGATQTYLRQTAAELQGHATGLRPTGTWAVQGEFAVPEPVEDEVDSNAETQPLMRLPEK